MASPLVRGVGIVAAAAVGWFGSAGVRDGLGADPTSTPSFDLRVPTQERTVTDRGKVLLADLRPGDCLRDETEARGFTLAVDVVPCTRPHHGEVFAQLPLSLSPYPGYDGAAARAERRCGTAVPAFARSAVSSGKVTLTYVFPTSAEGAAIDDTAVCILESSAKVSQPLPNDSAAR